MYVFRWNGASWDQERKLVATDGVGFESLGYSVSVDGDTVVAGAHLDDDNGSNSGSAYVFRWSGTTWDQEQKLLPADGAAEDLFGVTVSVSGDVAVVGAYSTDDNGANSGSAYVFSANPPSIPTVSHWGFAVMTLLILTAGTLVFIRRRPASA